jgi:N-carbamoylputrescine amidase
MHDTITLGLVQHSSNNDPANNLEKSINGIHAAATQGAQLILLQELHATHYFCQQETIAHFDLAEPIPGPTTTRLAKLAAELDVVIVASLFERRAAGLYHNTAVVLDRRQGLVGRYRKMHVPDDPGYYEKFYFTPGDLGFQPINTSVGCLGVLICWDQWFPEAARLIALAGADILLYPTAIGWDRNDSTDERQRQHNAWLTIQRAHAIANGIPVAACNRTGFEHDPTKKAIGIDFWGTSFIAGPQGEILAQASEGEDAVIVQTVDLRRNETVRRNWPYLRDRRIDAYGDLLKRYRDRDREDPAPSD